MTGPNDSSLAMNMLSVTSVKMVGYRKKPVTSQHTSLWNRYCYEACEIIRKVGPIRA